MSKTFDTLVRVRYAETDKMGVVYYGNYYIYFEIGRVEYMRNLGIDYKRMEIEDDSMIVVAESKCRYRRPARYDDLLRVRTRVIEVKRRTIHFGYEILRMKRASCWRAEKPFTWSAGATASPRRWRRSTGAFWTAKRDKPSSTGFCLWVWSHEVEHTRNHPHRLKPCTGGRSTVHFSCHSERRFSARGISLRFKIEGDSSPAGAGSE